MISPWDALAAGRARRAALPLDLKNYKAPRPLPLIWRALIALVVAAFIVGMTVQL